MSLLKSLEEVGVIVARMQVPYLTDSHKNLVKTVMDNHQSVLILLGTNNKISFKNPFPFLFRKDMIEHSIEMGKFDCIMPLPDLPSDKDWVENLDRIIESFCCGKNAIIYGGRDSFIPYYTNNNGKYTTKELLPNDNDSGTELRDLESLKIPCYSREAARAVLYTLNQLSKQDGLK